jgi:hypothetical protein
VITKKITARMMRKALRIFYQDYEKQYGHGTRKLDEFSVLTTAAEVYLDRMPELTEKSGNMVRYLLLDVLMELEKSGLMRSEGGLRYFLTELGYQEASKSRWRRFVDYWNENPGLNTVIAILSMVISGFSLWIAVLALNKPGT